MFTEIFIAIIVYLVIKLYYWYQQKRQKYQWFKKRGIKGPEPELLYGNFKQFRSNLNNSETLEQWTEKYGPVYGYFFGDRPYLVVNDLELIQEIFVANNRIFRDRPRFIIDAKPIFQSLIATQGEAWKKARKIISPTFSQNKVNSTTIKEAVEKCADDLISQIDKENNGDGPFTVEMLRLMQAFTLDVIAKTALNMNTNAYEKNDLLMNSVRDYFENAWNPVIEKVLAFGFLRYMIECITKYLPVGKMTEMVVGHLKRQVNLVVHGKVSDNKMSKNFLHSMLIHFANGDISEDEFIANLFLIILAGYETTANGITYLLYLLAQNKDIQNKLRQEIAKDGPDSPYIEMVWMETLRMYPPVPLFVTRETAEDFEINGFYIEKDTNVQIPVWSIHHREDIWKDPFKFDPQRFSPENRKSIHPSAFLPFGIGSRICLGIHLANVEVRSFLCKLLPKYEIDVCEQTPQPLLLKTPTVVINPIDPVYLKFIPLK